MRILLLAWGSRGDVEPFVALGAGLRRAGHRVTVAAPQDFGPWVRAHGLGYEEFAVSVAELTRTDLGRRWLSGTTRTRVGELRLMRAASVLSADPLVTTLLRAAPGQDLVVSSTLTFDAVWSLERVLDIRHVIALFAPVLQTSVGASYVYAPLPGRRSLINLLAGSLTSAAVHPVVAPIGAELRRRLGLPRPSPARLLADVRRTPTLMAVSPAVVPPAPDWPMPVRMTGTWRLPPADPEPGSDPRLVDFLAAGPPPVHLGFGSMPSDDPAATSRLVREGISRAGVRAVVRRGNADLDVPGDDVLMVDDVPHSWLLPRCAGAVGHGGAGTTAAALHAGVPQLVVPHMGDQFYWGRRVHELGVGARPVPRRELTPERLGDGLRALLDPGRTSAAAALGSRLAGEDGVARAVELICRLA